MHSPYLGLFYFSAQYLALHDASNDDGAALSVQNDIESHEMIEKWEIVG